MRQRLLLASVALVMGIVASTTAPAAATDDGPGPALSVDAAALRSALTCTGDLTRGEAPVLFLHGTTST
jgi:hypothetical protein